jgi:transcriptional regulator with XRE-family HTH domain
MTTMTDVNMEAVQDILRKFVFMDCRLGSHPRVSSTVYWLRGDALHCVATTGFTSGHLIGRTVSVSNSLSGYSVHAGKTAEWKLPTDTRFRDSELVNRYQLRSSLGVPISAGDERLGVLMLYLSGDHSFSEKSHVGKAQTLAALIAYAGTEATGAIHRPTPLSASIGAALTQARKELGLTQQQTAERFGGSRIALSRWEVGGQPPPMRALLRWCAALGLVCDDQPAIVTCVDVPPQLLDVLRDRPDELEQLTPGQFEHLIANRLD